MYVTFQYLTVSCIPAIGYVPNISWYDTGHLLIVADNFVVGKIPENLFWTVADILQYVSSKVLDTDCSWHFMVLYLYLGKVLIIFLVRYYFDFLAEICFLSLVRPFQF